MSGMFGCIIMDVKIDMESISIFRMWVFLSVGRLA